MAELIFIATTIFVAYVIFTVTDDKKHKSEPNKTEPAKPAVVTESVEVKVEATAEKPAEKPAPAKAKPVAAKPVAAKPAAKTAKPKAAAKPKATATVAVAPAASTEVPSDSLKNPKTGEVVKIPNSYAFAKRWVKDALVEEGLLDKIYKNNELDNEANAKIQAAIEQLKQMAKYH